MNSQESKLLPSPPPSPRAPHPPIEAMTMHVSLFVKGGYTHTLTVTDNNLLINQKVVLELRIISKGSVDSGYYTIVSNRP